jgi:Mg2+-importing ATPase
MSDTQQKEIHGLTSTHARELLGIHGYNAVVHTDTVSPFQQFLNGFKNPLIAILLIAASISFFSGSYIGAILIVSIIIASSVINFFVSQKSEHAIEALLKRVAPTTIVIRDSQRISIPVREVVPGDIVYVESGNVIPADGIVISGNDFFVNEAGLTGESFPNEKYQNDSVYLGTGVVTGNALLEIKVTGKKTKFSSITKMLQAPTGENEFEKGISSFSRLIAKIVLSMSVIVFFAGFIIHGDAVNSFLFAAALAVGLTPELLPMIVALNVSRASIRMSQRGVLVKRLSAVESFGSMDILCTDKTGTLTEDHVSVIECVDVRGNHSDHVVLLGFLSSSYHTGQRGILDDAIKSYRVIDISSYRKVEELPFDFTRRRDSIVVGRGDTFRVITKGAPESIFPVCRLTDEEKSIAEKTFLKLSGDGYRVLAVATKSVAVQEQYDHTIENNLILVGYVAFIDPPKQGVRETLARLAGLGITVKVITGDHILVAKKICREVGISDVYALDGVEIADMSDDELMHEAERVSIFARVDPSQKNRIITLLQKKGHVVGYMGDGINDAPSLRTADVGISVENGVDVAKESADIVLVKKGLEDLVEGVREGRHTFANTIKYITMAVSSSFGNVFSMTGASFILPFLPMLPQQVLLTNLLYESAQFSLPFDSVDAEVLSRPKPWNLKFIKKFMLVFGALSSIFDFATFFVLYAVFDLSGSFFQTGWFIQSFATQILVIFSIRSAHSIFRAVKPKLAVVCSMFGALILAWGIALTSIGKIFGFSPLPIPVIITVIIIAILYLISVEIAKYFFYRKSALRI